MSRDPKNCFLLCQRTLHEPRDNFLCHVTTSFVDHVMSFLQPAFQNYNGRFTPMLILIVYNFQEESKKDKNKYQFSIKSCIAFICV